MAREGVVPGGDITERRAGHGRSIARSSSSAHSSTNRVLLCVALGTDVRDYRKRFVQGQGNLTVLRWVAGDGPADAKLIVGNDLGHLRGPDSCPGSSGPGTTGLRRSRRASGRCRRGRTNFTYR